MKKLNVVIPCAGDGSRFKSAGYDVPKPFIDVDGKFMIERVLDCLSFNNREVTYHFIFRESHLKEFPVIEHLDKLGRKYTVTTVEKLTDGAARTVLLASQHFDNDEELLIANSDQFLDWSASAFTSLIDSVSCDGAIVTTFSNHPKWSYVKLDYLGWIVDVREKEVISNICTVGVYYFKHGSSFVTAANSMIDKNIRTNNEFYVAPVYNEMLYDGCKILNYPISNQAFWGLGIPDDLNLFLLGYKGKK